MLINRMHNCYSYFLYIQDFLYDEKNARRKFIKNFLNYFNEFFLFEFLKIGTSLYVLEKYNSGCIIESNCQVY